jgi:hypothetical protein
MGEILPKLGLESGGFVGRKQAGGASLFLVMACFVLVGPPLAACLLRRSTRHVASDGPTSNKNGDAPEGEGRFFLRFLRLLAAIPLSFGCRLCLAGK